MVEEPLELREMDIESIGLVPMGANKRKFIVIKDITGGEEYVDIQEVAKAIMADPDFWERLSESYADIEKQEGAEGGEKDKKTVRAKMALRILGAESVDEAISALRAALGKAESYEEPDKEKKEEEEGEEEEKTAKAQDAQKAGKKEEEYEEEERYPKPGATKSGVPEGFSEIFQALMDRVESSERVAKEALEKLEQAHQEVRRKELHALAERYAALPEIQPEKFVDTLVRLEEADPELFNEITRVLDGARAVVTEIYGELGTQRTPTHQEPFIQKVEARVKELEAQGLDHAEAYSQAYIEVSDRHPNLAWAYLQTSRGVS